MENIDTGILTVTYLLMNRMRPKGTDQTYRFPEQGSEFRDLKKKYRTTLHAHTRSVCILQNEYNIHIIVESPST